MKGEKVSDDTMVFTTFGDLAIRPMHVTAVREPEEQPLVFHRHTAHTRGDTHVPVFFMLLSVGVAFMLLLLSLVGQFRLTDINSPSDGSIAVSDAASSVRVRAAAAPAVSAAVSGNDTDNLTASGDSRYPTADKATVLHVQQQSRIAEGWNTVIQAVEACFR